MMMAALAIMGLAGCDHYNCSSAANLGASSCTASGTGLGQSGGGSTSSAFVFAVDEAGAGGTGTAGTIDGYTLNSGATTFAATASYTAPTIPLDDPGVGMVVAQSQYLYAGFGTTNQLYGWTVASSGSLASISGSPYTAPFMSGVGNGALATSAMVTNPAGTFLFIADTANDKIYVYQIGSGGALTATATSPVSVPIPPGNLTTDGLGKYLYMTETFSNHTGFEIAAYTIGTDGSLTAITGSPFSYPMWQVVGEPTGKYLIGTTGKNLALNGADDNQLYVFDIAQSGANAGALISETPFTTTYSPLNIAVQSNTNGNLVYSFSDDDSLNGFNAVEGYELNATSGALTALTNSPFVNVADGSWGQLDQSGAYLFVFGGVNNGSTITYSIGALDVGSGGALTQPTTSLTLATGGFWAVADPK
jgi:6-phosphogluconolactonase (cycloisomerase 2 family)